MLVEYESGVEEWTTTGKCRRAVEEEEPPGTPPLAIGDRVECRYAGGENYYPGKVTNQRGQRVLIDYDDGSREWNSPGMCRKLA